MGHRVSWRKKVTTQLVCRFVIDKPLSGEMPCPGSLLQVWLQVTAIIARRTQRGSSQELMARSVCLLMWLPVSIQGVQHDPGGPGRPVGLPPRRWVFYGFPQAAFSVIRMVTLWLMKNISLVQT